MDRLKAETHASHRAAIIGVDVGGTKILGALVDLNGNLIADHEVRWIDFERPDPHDPAPLFAVIDRLMAAAGDLEILGIGIGAPGVTDPARGLVIWAPNSGWRDYALRQIVANHYQLPVFVENDVNLATLGEQRFGAGGGARNMICIMIGTGIGSGIIIDNHLYRGANFSAGEIGYMLTSVANFGGSYVDFGALESVASGRGIAERVPSRLAGETIVSAEQVFEAAERGESWASEIVEQTLDYLALMLANVCALLDPERIVLGGGVGKASAHMIDQITERLKRVIPVVPPIEFSRLGSYAGIKGAIPLVLEGLKNTHTDF